MQVEIHGWHIHPEAAICKDCGEPATVVVNPVDDYWEFNLCDDCLTHYTVVKDAIDEILRKAVVV